MPQSSEPPPSSEQPSADEEALSAGMPEKSEPFIPPLPKDVPSIFRTLFWLVCFGIGWLIILGLGAIAFLRIYHHDGTVQLIWLNAFTYYVYLPAFFVLAMALWKKRWVLVVASLGVVGMYVSFIAPDLVAHPHAVAKPKKGEKTTRSVRIVFHNVFGHNENLEKTLRDDLALKPDVYCIAEYSGKTHRAVLEVELSETLPNSTTWKGRWTGSDAIFSDHPFIIRRWFESRSQGKRMLETSIELDGVPLRIIAVHSPRPEVETLDDYRRYMEDLEIMIEDSKVPTIVIGDFNATQHSKCMQQLTKGRMRNAHREIGRGYATTWPAAVYNVPPIRIDHALLSPEIKCLNIQEGEGNGSDHRPLILDIEITGADIGSVESSSNQFERIGRGFFEETITKRKKSNQDVANAIE